MIRQSAIYAGLVAATAILSALLYAHFTKPLEFDDFYPVNVTIADPDKALDRFAGMLRWETVSSLESDNHVVDPGQFTAQNKYIRRTWPTVFKKLEAREVNKHSLLLKWQGSDKALKPVLCISHLDVVAVDPGSNWTHPAFGGVVADGFVWGRGALDVKSSVAALLEAVSILLGKGFTPKRTLYIALGHDEEVSGAFGAGATAELLKREGVEFEFIADEGGAVLEDGVGKLLQAPIAVVGTAEKAFQNFEIEVYGKGGHSMVLPRGGSSAITRLATILSALDNQPPPPRLVPPTSHMLKAIGGALPSGILGLILRNCDVWPLDAILARLLARMRGEVSNCVRTTAIATDIEVFPPGKNVIPSLAKAHINFRVLPDEDPEFTERYLKQLSRPAAEAGEVRIFRTESLPLSSLSNPRSFGFQTVRQAALETLRGPQGLVVAPYLMLGRTDSSQYTRVYNGSHVDVFRFMPFSVNSKMGALRSIHGLDERLGTESYLGGVRYYTRFLELALG